jgi:hypothetical protein
MSIKPQPEIEQLSIWTFLERLAVADGNRVSAEPLDANIIDLSNWIGSLDLESAGDALVTWGVSFRDRAIQLLDEWQLKSPLTPAELVEPFYDRSLFDDLVLGRMEWDLGELVETIEADYPAERQAAPGIAPVSKDAALELADLQTALDTAHDENVSEWGAAIAQYLEANGGSVTLVDLSNNITLDLVKVWLGLLLGGLDISIEQTSDDFYSQEGILIV